MYFLTVYKSSNGLHTGEPKSIDTPLIIIQCGFMCIPYKYCCTIEVLLNAHIDCLTSACDFISSVLSIYTDAHETGAATVVVHPLLVDGTLPR